MSRRRPSAAPFGRRDLLAAAGATLAVPPFLGRAFAAPDELPPRLIIIMQANGTNQPGFWPRGAFRSPILDPILEHPRLAAVTTAIKGVRIETPGFGNEHDRGFCGLWTGVPTMGLPSEPWAGGPSIDQMLKHDPLVGPRLARVPHPTLNTAVHAGLVPPKNPHRVSFSYAGARRPIPAQTDPRRLFAAFFSGGRAPRPPQQRRSILDATAADLAALMRRVGPAERAKLEIHAAALRQMERRLDAAPAPLAGARCLGPAAAPSSSMDAGDENDIPELVALMLDFVAQALVCNLTRVVTFQFGPCGNSWRYRWLGLDIDAHEEAAHRDTGDPTAAARMVQIGRWHAGEVARLALALDAVPEGDGTALDHSLIVWANENATGYHGLDNVPIVLVGRAGGRLRATGRLVDAGVHTHHRLGTSLLRLMGSDAAGFGDRPACGPWPGVG